MQASSALAYIIFEMILYLATLYITNTTTSLKTLDLLAYSGYKYTTMISSLLAGLMLGRTGYYCCLVYASCALSYFLVSVVISVCEWLHGYGFFFHPSKKNILDLSVGMSIKSLLRLSLTGRVYSTPRY